MTPMWGIMLCAVPVLRVPGKELLEPAGESNKSFFFFFQLLWLNAHELQDSHLVSVCSPSV